jgi:phosphatidylserine/phosphatidylglycerophosphate/cardiolipin synthase-like enzyme
VDLNKDPSHQHKLFIVSYVPVGFDTILAALERAALRNVKTDILHGGRVDVDSVTAFSERLPLADIYVWKSALESAGKYHGAVHAKCAVADGNMAFVTSANLTKAALEKNMELGVLIKGGEIPEKLNRHLDSLILSHVIGKV